MKEENKFISISEARDRIETDRNAFNTASGVGTLSGVSWGTGGGGLETKLIYPEVYSKVKDSVGGEFEDGELIKSIQRLSQIVDVPNLNSTKAASCCELIVEKNLKTSILRTIQIIFECELESATKEGLSVIRLDGEMIVKGEMERSLCNEETKILEDVLGPSSDVEKLFPVDDFAEDETSDFFGTPPITNTTYTTELGGDSVTTKIGELGSEEEDSLVVEFGREY